MTLFTDAMGFSKLVLALLRLWKPAAAQRALGDNVQFGPARTF
jgi:hypothetical protein